MPAPSVWVAASLRVRTPPPCFSFSFFSFSSSLLLLLLLLLLPPSSAKKAAALASISADLAQSIVDMAVVVVGGWMDGWMAGRMGAEGGARTRLVGRWVGGR
ncbi:hypothetical protein IWZ00DRAFT_497657, partial [Phyllosticta capitalensis]